MKKKLTKEQIEEMKKLYASGMKPRQVALRLGVNPTTAMYHLFPEKRLKYIAKQKKYYQSLSPEKKTEIYLRYKAYVLDWQNKRYHSNNAFKLERLHNSKKQYLRNKLKEKEVKQNG